MFKTNETKKILKRLEAYPNLLNKVEEILDLMEIKEVNSVDYFEEALVPEVRNLGTEIMQTWATNKEQQDKKDLENNKYPHHSKKNYIGKHFLEK